MDEKAKKKEVRLMSLDALRGFDMLFIMGLSGLIVAICKLFPANGLTEWISNQMSHVEWDGLAHHDTIFPLFLFVAGISFPFSLSKQRAGGKSESDILYKVIKRGVILVILGAVYNNLLSLDFANVRYASVLGRIGLAWMFSAILYMKFKPKTCAYISAGILIGYWLMMWLIPGGSDPFSFENNLVGKIDQVLLPGHLHKTTFDPEGLFSTVPAIVTAMLGMLTGAFVQMPEDKFSGTKKVNYMLIAAVVLIVIGWAWSFVFPINKSLWTSTFVCVVAGYSLIMFALFYYIIDVKGHYKWSFFFRVVGLNSITIYLAQRIINFNSATHFFVDGLVSKCPEALGAVVYGVSYMAVCWLFLYFLYKKNVFLKV